MPCPARASAIALPTPEPPPVTSAWRKGIIAGHLNEWRRACAPLPHGEIALRFRPDVGGGRGGGGDGHRPGRVWGGRVFAWRLRADPHPLPLPTRGRGSPASCSSAPRSYLQPHG